MELTVAIVSAIVAILSASLSLYGQRRIAILQHELATKRELESRDAKADALLAKYRDPLLRASYDLQSRLFSTAQLGFLRIYYNRSDRDQRYARNHTLYSIAEYFGWVEIIRREVQFLDLGEVDATRQLQEFLQHISSLFLTDGLALHFRLFRGDQRAIGELMLVERDRGDGATLDCMGFAEFSRALEDKAFSEWFQTLCESIEYAANDPSPDHARLIHIQHGLIDLIDFLDPDRLRIPKSREKIMTGD